MQPEIITISEAEAAKDIEPLATWLLTVGIPAAEKIADLPHVVLALERQLRPWWGNEGFLLPAAYVLLSQSEKARSTWQRIYDKNSKAGTIPARLAYERFYKELFGEQVPDLKS